MEMAAEKVSPETISIVSFYHSTRNCNWNSRVTAESNFAFRSSTDVMEPEATPAVIDILGGE